jgi:hypothetical protein
MRRSPVEEKHVRREKNIARRDNMFSPPHERMIFHLHQLQDLNPLR